jgi:hypothetical protein
MVMFAVAVVIIHYSVKQRDIIRSVWGSVSPTQQKICRHAGVLFTLSLFFLNLVQVWEFPGRIGASQTLTSGIEVLRQDAQPGDRVYIALFQDFAPAYFYAPELRYSQGMDPMLTFLANRDLYWLYHHTLYNPERICDAEECVVGEKSVHDVVRHAYGARYVLYEYPLEFEGDRNLVDKFQIALEHDPRFVRLYDERSEHTRVRVFRVEE